MTQNQELKKQIAVLEKEERRMQERRRVHDKEETLAKLIELNKRMERILDNASRPVRIVEVKGDDRFVEGIVVGSWGVVIIIAFLALFAL